MRDFSKIFWGCVIALTMFCEASSGLFNVKPLKQRLSSEGLCLLENCLAEKSEAAVLNEPSNIEKIKNLSFFNECLSVYEGKVIIDFWKEGGRDFQNRVGTLSEDDMEILRGIVKDGVTKKEMSQIFWRGITYNTAVAYRDQLKSHSRGGSNVDRSNISGVDPYSLILLPITEEDLL